MSLRSTYLICYDVSSPRRLRRVHQFLLGFKVGGQKSSFECWLTRHELRKVRENLAHLIDQTEDRVHIFQLDPRMKPDCFGIAVTVATDTPFIIA